MNVTKTTRKLTDNLNETYRALGQYVLDNAPRGLIPRSRELATQLAQGGEQSYMGFTFSRGMDRSIGACELFVQIGGLSSEMLEDKDGNRWQELPFEVQVSWASYGSSDPMTSLVRIELMREVALFAQELKAVFTHPIYHMVWTKEQRDEQEWVAKKNRSAKRIKELVLANCKNMRVLVEREVAINEDEEELVFPDEVTYDHEGKTYKVFVTAGRGFTFTRTA